MIRNCSWNPITLSLALFMSWCWQAPLAKLSSHGHMCAEPLAHCWKAPRGETVISGPMALPACVPQRNKLPNSCWVNSLMVPLTDSFHLLSVYGALFWWQISMPSIVKPRLTLLHPSHARTIVKWKDVKIERFPVMCFIWHMWVTFCRPIFLSYSWTLHMAQRWLTDYIPGKHDFCHFLISAFNMWHRRT